MARRMSTAPPAQTKSNLPDRALVAACVLGATAWISIAVWQGYDFEWDVQNYHFYNGFALLHLKLFANLQPAMMQTYFAPLMDAAFYILVRFLPPTGVVAAIAAFQSLIIPILFQLARFLLPAGRGRMALAAALSVLGAAAPVALYEAGGVLGDSTSSVLVLGALLALVKAVARSATASRPRLLAFAGALAGSAAGLKLTNMAFAIGLIAALLATTGLPRNRTAVQAAVTRVAACLAGIGAAFMLTYGWWGAILYWHFSNPVFPEFNQFFRSPYAAPASFADPTFALPTWRAKLLFPFLRTSVSGRLDAAGLYDLRMAITLPLCLAGVLASRIGRTRADGTATDGAPTHALLVFVLTSYAGWLLMFPTNRYLVAVDIVAPLACVAAALAVWRARATAWSVTAALALALPASAATSLPLWWLPGEHRHGDAGGYFGVSFAPPPGLDGAIVAMLGGWPSTFVIPYFPRHTSFVRLQGSMYYFTPATAKLNGENTQQDRRAVFGNAMGAAICRRLGEPGRALFLLRPAPDTRTDLAAMTYYGIAQAPGACTPVTTKSTLHIELCPARRLPVRECQQVRAVPF